MTSLCSEELETFKEDIQIIQFIGVQYLDTWDYEDEYSHNEIEESRDQFIQTANKILEENHLPYIMMEMCENAMICDKKTGKVIKN